MVPGKVVEFWDSDGVRTLGWLLVSRCDMVAGLQLCGQQAPVTWWSRPPKCFTFYTLFLPFVSDYLILLLRTHSVVIHHLWH